MALGPRPEGVADMDWLQLEATVAACRACGLCAGRTQTVFGVGARSADWMVIGEAPARTKTARASPSSARPASCWMPCWPPSACRGRWRALLNR
uniref:hypothetical protein n=1 Tax=Ottowia beijingensis TaxID=1207057 RepID=UPI00358DAA9A